MPRPLALVNAPPVNSGDDAMRALAVALAPYLRGLLAAERREDDLVDVADFLPAAAGSSKRSHMRFVNAACSAGKIAGASRVGRRWKARRNAVEAWLHCLGPRSVSVREEDADDLDDVVRSLMRSGRR